MTKIKKTICNITASLLLAGIMGTGLSTVALAREAVTEKEKVQMGGGYAASNQLDGTFCPPLKQTLSFRTRMDLSGLVDIVASSDMMVLILTGLPIQRA